MQLKLRPAWRKQWFLILVALSFLAGPLLYLHDSPDTTIETTIPTLLTIEAPFLIISLIIWLVVVVRRYSWKYTVDSENIESRHGIVAREVRVIRVSDLRNVNVRQSIFHRLINIGAVEFSSAGTAGVEVVFAGVHDPMTVMHKVQDMT